MLASSSKHALHACTRTTLSQSHASSASSIRRALPAMGSIVKRGVATRSLDRRQKLNVLRSNTNPTVQLYESGQDEKMFTIRRGARTAEYNLVMRNLLAIRKPDKVLELATKMKRTVVQPDVGTYNALIGAFAVERNHLDAWAAFRDMLAMEIQPDATTVLQLLLAHSTRDGNDIFTILEEMEKLGVQPNARIYDFIVRYFLDCDNLEMALVKLAEMNDMGFSPGLRVAQHLVEAAGQLGQVRLAVDLADAYEQTTVRRLDSETWVKLLGYCAEELFVDGVLRCWDKVINDLHIRVDEGLCQLVLHTAARHGLPTLAAEAIRQLEAIGVKFEEHHLVPMLDAFVKNQQLKEAFSVLDLMRTAKTDPTVDSAHSILEFIRHDPELVDNAYTLLEEIHKEGQKADVIAANVLIKAAGVLRDLQRAVGIYKAMPSLGVEPDAATFEMLLKACRAVRHMELGERLFGELQESGVKPTAKTFETFISLILTETDYENAFYYLEEMKGAGLTPSYTIYEEIVKTCVANGDTRYKLAMEELGQMGYSASKRLRHFINTGGREWTEQFSDDERLPYETRKRLKEVKESAEGEVDGYSSRIAA